MSTSKNEPQLIALRGTNYHLYQSGIARGRAEAWAQCAEDFGRWAGQYEVAHSKSGDDTSKAFAEMMRSFEKQTRVAVSESRGVADQWLTQGLAALQLESQRADEVRLQLAHGRPSGWARFWGWCAQRLARTTG